MKGGKAKDSLDGVSMGDGCEGQSEILAKDLGEAFGNKMSLESGDLAIFVTFYIKDPFALYSLFIWW